MLNNSQSARHSSAHVAAARAILAKNPTTTNAQIATELGLSVNTIAYAAVQARVDLGINWQYSRVKVNAATYYAACRQYGHAHIKIPFGGVIPIIRQATPLRGTVDARAKEVESVSYGLDVLKYLAAHPGSKGKEVMRALPQVRQESIICHARRVLGLRNGGGAEPGYIVERDIYLAACEKYGLTPVEIPADNFFPKAPMRYPNTSRITKPTVATVPTSEVPAEVLAATPRDLRPATVEEREKEVVIAQEGVDQYAQLRALVNLLRTEMAKRGIDTVRIEPGGVTLRRTVVVEEPFI